MLHRENGVGLRAVVVRSERPRRVFLIIAGVIFRWDRPIFNLLKRDATKIARSAKQVSLKYSVTEKSISSLEPVYFYD